MRNANAFDIKLVQEGGHVLCGVVYDSPYGLVHRKKVGGDLAAQLEECVFLMETAENDTVVALHSSNLRAVTKGPSHTPKKPKRKPVKGTKPWTKIPYKFEDVEVGDTVAYTESDGAIVKYLVNEKTDEQWDAENGGASYLWKPSSENKAHIIKPYKEPVNGQEKRVSNTDYYQIGDRFEIVDPDLSGSLDVCMLCMISSEKAMLIAKDGNRWVDNTCSVERDARCRKEDVGELIGLPNYAYKKI